MESLHQGFREGTKSRGKKLKIINECLIHSKKTDWKFENGVLYHCSKDKSIGVGGERIRNGIPLRKHSQEAGEGVLSFR